MSITIFVDPNEEGREKNLSSMGVEVRGVEWDLSPRPSLQGRGLLRLQIEGSGPR